MPVDDPWIKIVQIHNYTKSLFLLSEEIDYSEFIQPNNELKNALEHIIRAKAEELEITKNSVNNGDYIQKNLEKALGHEYRAFFDTADWCGIVLREKILNALAPYDMSCIRDVLPDYYSQDRATIDEICNNIAKIRENKDVDRKNELLKEVEYYLKQLNRLYGIWEKIRDKDGVLNDCQKKQHNESFKKSVTQWLLTALIGIICALLGAFFAKIFC